MEHALRVQEFGLDSNPPAVLIHGIGVSSEYFVPYAKKLASNFKVYALDLPGYGKTPKPKQPLTIEELADVVISFMTDNKIQNSVIVGQSMGCQIVTHAAVKMPRLFSKVILLSPTVNKEERSVLKQGWRLCQDTFNEPVSANITVFRNYIRMGIRRYLITARYMVRDRIEKTLARVTVPVLVVRGEKDPIVPKNWADFLSRTTPNGSMVELASAPHLLQMESPKEAAHITKEFINS